jgi:hypothetical protein
MVSMTLPPAVEIGVQWPRVRSLPAGADHLPSAGDDAVELADRAGLHLMPWQALVLRDALRERPGGRWAAFEVGLVVPRQNGKGSVLEALELAALFLSDPDLPPPLILHSAHEFKTSAEHFRRVRDLVESTPMLSKQVRIIRTAAGAEAIELHSGARLRFVTRTGGSGRGFSADLVVIDEAYNLTAEQMAAVLPTLSARPNPQVWYTSSAGMGTSEQLARIRSRGTAGGDPSLAYFEWSASDQASLDDRQAWAEANPALGYRIPEVFIEAERAALPDDQFGRERLGLWQDFGTHLPPVSLGAWAATEANVSKPSEPVFFLTAAKEMRSATIAAAAMHDGRPHVELADHRSGVAWLDDRVRELRDRYPAAKFGAYSAGPMKAWAPTLAEAGIELDLLTGPQAVAACAHLQRLSDDLAFTHSPDETVSDSLRGAKSREMDGGGWVWDWKNSKGDLAPLAAVTGALWLLESISRPPALHEWPDEATIRAWEDEHARSPL